MNLEQLQAMSDVGLNKLSAVEVMGFKYRGYCETPPEMPYVSPNPRGILVLHSSDESRDWNPTTDMNDAMGLVERLGDKYNFELNRKPSGVEHLLYESKFIDGDKVYSAVDGKDARAITIASILAKTNQ